MKDHTEATSLHNRAMELAQLAVLAQERDPVRSCELFRSALESERKAAEIWEGGFNLEPTRSILYRSASALARDCHDYDEAERLIARGLAGQPPSFVVRDLEKLRDIVHAERTAPPRARAHGRV